MLVQYMASTTVGRLWRKVIATFTDDNPHVPDIDVDSWAEFHEILRMNEIEQVHLFVNEVC